MLKQTVLGIRLFALFILYRALLTLHEFGNHFIFQGNSEIETIFTLISFFSLLVFFLVLFTRAKSISQYLFPNTRDANLKIDDYQKLSAVLFSSIGLYIIFSSINMILNSTAMLLVFNDFKNEDPINRFNQFLAYLFGGVIQLVAGIALFTGGKKLSKWWYASR
tara:strand:+ start:1453 stop:1944 length:492 start_codon:yes stop_codon:yes gene_type:complete